MKQSTNHSPNPDLVSMRNFSRFRSPISLQHNPMLDLPQYAENWDVVAQSISYYCRHFRCRPMIWKPIRVLKYERACVDVGNASRSLGRRALAETGVDVFSFHHALTECFTTIQGIPCSDQIFGSAAVIICYGYWQVLDRQF